MSIKLKDTIYDLINKANKDGSGNTITSTYLKKTGDVLNTKGEQYNGNFGINLNNSDIIGANSITFNDYCESSHEGIRFCRSDVYGKYDAISARNGVFYFSPNGTISTADTTGSFPTDYVILHSNNYSTYAATKDHNHNSTYALISHGHSNYVDLSSEQTISGKKTFTNSIKISTGYSISDENGSGVVGVYPTGWTGLPTDGSAVGFGTTGKTAYIRSSGNNLYHYRHDNKASYLILDASNWSSYCASASHTHSYLPLSGGTMNSNANIIFQGTGGIQYKGSKGHYQMIGFLDNTGDAYGDGIRIGGGGTVIVGAGESSTALVSNSIVTDFNDENLHLSADGNIIFYSGCNTISSRKTMTLDSGGTLSVNGTAVSLSGHTHGYASKVTVGSTAYSVSSNNITIPAYPTSLKCPASLTIQLNGTSQGAWDGSAAKTINITPASIGASASHSHPYLPLAGGTMNSGACITFANGNGATVAMNLTNSFLIGVNSLVFADSCNGSQEGIQFPRADNSAKYDSLWVKNGVAYLGVNAASYTEAAGTNYTLIHSGNYTSYCAASSHGHTKLNNYYSSRPTSIAPGVSGDGSMFHFKCTSSVTDTTTDPGDAHILHFNWDNTGGYDFQIAGLTSESTMKIRGMGGGTWKSWVTVLTSSNWSSYCAAASHSHSYLPLSGGTVNNGALNMTNNRLRMVGTNATPAWNQAGAITWTESVDDSQPVSIVYTSYDSYRAPAGLKVMGNQGGEWFEAPKIYCSNFYIGGSEITFVT